MDYGRLTGTHDLSLPAWGPYSKKFCGIAHLAHPESGHRFDLSVFPGPYRRNVRIPSALHESGYHVWDAAPDLSYFSLRHQLEWKDRVYADIAYCLRDDASVLIRSRLVNRTDDAQNLVLHALCSLQPPETAAVRPVLPSGGVWIDALSYTSFRPASPRPLDTLVFDAMRPGEMRMDGSVGGGVLGKRLCDEPGGTVVFNLDIPPAAELLVRYATSGEGPAHIRFSGAVDAEIPLPPSADFGVHRLPLRSAPAGTRGLTLRWEGGASLVLDGFACVPVGTADAFGTAPAFTRPDPAAESEPGGDSLLLDYGPDGPVYGLAWDPGHMDMLSLKTDDPAEWLGKLANYHPGTAYDDGGGVRYHDVRRQPVFLAPRSSAVLWLYAVTGTRHTVTTALERFHGTSPSVRKRAYGTAAARRYVPGGTPAGEPFVFGNERMAATVLTNTVWPVRCKGGNVRHRTPGRCWNSLYTWDSGFIGLGLLEIDTDQAAENLNAYLTEPGDPETAFVLHGSPVPVQFFLFQELWNRTGLREAAAHFYPRLRQYYGYLAGKDGTSASARFASGLLQTWDCFYNSGGWDDYPPQRHVHAACLTGTVAPVVTTAMAVRCAKILARTARLLGRDGDADDYDADATAMTGALQRHAWDPGSGYFSYVVHDAAGAPVGPLRYGDGTNYNMGLDGITPLVAGACTPAQERLILERLSDARRLWTPAGLSTVDRSAPYYRPDGYWNGAVWMPYQWFVWKALIDLGAFAAADRIALTALGVWARETGASYHCMEHFTVETGRGAGWHQFSGLSSPVLNWYGAYFRPTRVTTGNDLWIDARSVSGDGYALEVRCRPSRSTGSGIMAAMPPDRAYALTWNEKPVPHRAPFPGVLQAVVPSGDAPGLLRVEPV